MYPPPATVPSIVSAEKGGAYLTGLLRVRVSRSGLVWWFATYRIFDACFTYGTTQDTYLGTYLGKYCTCIGMYM